MKLRKVQTIASDEEAVRLDIFEGRIPLGEAGDRLMELALAQLHRSGENTRRINQAVLNHNELIELLSTPWPIRWWMFFKKWRVSRRTTP